MHVNEEGLPNTTSKRLMQQQKHSENIGRIPHTDTRIAQERFLEIDNRKESVRGTKHVLCTAF